MRKSAAAIGEMKSFCTCLWKINPTAPAGTVPTINSKPNFASGFMGKNFRADIKPSTPPIMQTQSSRYTTNSVSAVAKCVATTNVRKESAF
jgi:hypothetical protein